MPHLLFARPSIIALGLIFTLLPASCVMICIIVNWHGMGCQGPSYFSLSNCAVFYGLLACTLLVPLIIVIIYFIGNATPMRGVSAQLVQYHCDTNTLNSDHQDTNQVPVRDPC